MKRVIPLFAASLVAMAGLVGPVTQAAAAEPTGIDLQPESVAQTIDGFGYSAAFQRTARLEMLSADKRNEAADLLLGPEGAAPSILRLGIGGQSNNTYDVMMSIQPQNPGGPNATPNYQWDGKDNGQVWFAKAAKERGVPYLYGNPWTAPGYMKNNGSATNGGTLCGLAGTNCASGDWRAAYANYLVAWANFYKQEGVPINGLTIGNEVDYTSSYESMRFTPAQANEFVKIFGPVAENAGYDVLCCESYGWNQGKTYHSALANDPAADKYVKVLTAHSYASRSDTPYETGKSLWMSEYAVSSAETGWNEKWDGGTGVATDAIVMAEHMQDTLTKGNASGYLWWLGASQGASASLLQVDVPADTYRVSQRLWTMAAFSRYIRPGAERFDAVHSIPNLKVSAYRNTDGSQVVELLNLGASAVSTDIDLGTQPDAYVVDNGHKLEKVDGVATTADGVTDLQLPARSLVTLVTPPDGPGAGIPLTANVAQQPGSLTMSVADYGNSVELAGGDNVGDRLRFQAALPDVTVTDSRNADQAGNGGWAVTGRATAFTSQATSVGADHLGWTPALAEAKSGVTAGATVATAMSGGPGLAEPASLARATSDGRFGATKVSAGLQFELPVDTPSGQYSSALTVSLFPVD